MTRKMLLGLFALAAALLLAGGAALAREIDCGGGQCVGTDRADAMFGTTGEDDISGRDGNDTIAGDPAVSPFIYGDDLIRGGAGRDDIRDGNHGDPDVDQIFGGKGADRIDVREGDNSRDVVDCGPGTDTVLLDETDTVTNCETVDHRPIS